MDRRTLIGAISLGALGATLAVSSRPTGRMPQIGFLRDGQESMNQSLVHALRELGWIENQSIRYEPRHTENVQQLPDLAADLVRRRVDLIITVGTRATRAAKQATAEIPIVFSVGGNPIETGLVVSLSRPGGNVTGFAQGLYGEKQLQVMKSALPTVARVAYPVLGGFVQGEVAPGLPSPSAQKALGIETQGVNVENLEFAQFFASAKQAGADATLIPDVALLAPRLEHIGVEASKSGLPAIGFRRTFAESGGLLSYGPLLAEQFARIAIQIDRILRGARPADLPVEQPTRFEFVINLKAAKALGLSIPRLVRLSADELIG